MEKLIIENRTDLSLIDIFTFVHGIISAGRISNNGTQYCYVTTYEKDGREFYVITNSNKRSDKFTIYEKHNPSLEPTNKAGSLS